MIRVPNSETKDVGQLFEIVQTDVALAAFDVQGELNVPGGKP